MGNDQLEIFSPDELFDSELFEKNAIEKIHSDEEAGKYTAARLKKLKPKCFNAVRIMLGSNIPITQISETLGLHFYTIDAIARLEADYITRMKDKLAKNTFLISQVLLEKIIKSLDKFEMRKADDIYKMALTAANLAEKGTLLSGGVTQRVEHVQAKDYSSSAEFEKDVFGDDPIEVE